MVGTGVGAGVGADVESGCGGVVRCGGAVGVAAGAGVLSDGQLSQKVRAS